MNSVKNPYVASISDRRSSKFSGTKEDKDIFKLL